MSIKLTFERQTLSFHTDAVGIGRDPDNQVAFPNDSRLALQHAILRCVNGRWIVESRDGGPIRIGNGRPSKFAWLNPGDVIHLTETGPELIFEPCSDGTSVPTSRAVPAKPSQPAPPTAVASAIAPYIPFIPDTAADAAIEKRKQDNDSISAHLGPHAPQPVPAKVITQNSIDDVLESRSNPLILLVAFAMLTIVVVAGLAMISRGVGTASSETSGSIAGLPGNKVTDLNPGTSTLQPLPENPRPDQMTPGPDPSDFLVLIGFGDLKAGDRPVVLGVGWLWDDRTAVTSRAIGTAIEMLAKPEGSPRQGCVIHGEWNEVVEVLHPSACKEISILRVKGSFTLSRAARNQWRRVNAAEIEPQRLSGKRFHYHSYDPLPRPADTPESYDLPLCEYDRNVCHLNREQVRLENKSHEYLLESTSLARGGFVVDENNKVVGMVPLYSPIIWTETLERVLSPN